MKRKLTTLVVSLALTGLVGASPISSAATSSLPSVKMQGGVSYVTGGIGEDEAAGFKRAAATYPLELLFAQKAQPKDAYVADVKVVIRDRSGNPVLDTTTDGPFLLARLPAGKYQIEANYRGVQKHEAVEIHPGKHRRAVFVWARPDYSETIVSSVR